MSQHDSEMTHAWPSAVVWDLDGTLVESAPDLAAALNTLLNEKGRPGHRLSRVRPMIGGGVAKLIERGFRASGAPLEPSAVEVLVPRFMEIYSACATRKTALVPNARDVLDHFYNAGVRQGLCTNKPIEVTRMILCKLDIHQYFRSVVGGDSTPMKKPHPLPLLTCLEEMEAHPEDAIMIGDSGADVGAARAAHVPVILVPDGYTGVPAVSLGADWVVSKLADIPASVPPLPPLRQSA
jgi:phosphoglycolate phosphatase